MTRAQLLEITAALLDVKGWLRDVGDALVVFVFLAVNALALFNALRPLVQP